MQGLKTKDKICDANFPHLQPVAKLRRNQRGEIGRQLVKAHYAAASVHIWSHLTNPTPTQTNNGISQIDHDTGKLIPAILFEKHHGDEMGIGWGRGLPTATWWNPRLPRDTFRPVISEVYNDLWIQHGGHFGSASFMEEREFQNNPFYYYGIDRWPW